MDIVLVVEDGLDALYADGKLVYTENPIYVGEGIEGLRIKFGFPLTISSFEVKDADSDWLEDREDYPEDLNDVKIGR